MSFKDQLIADAAAVFLNSAEFAEAVTIIRPDGSQKEVQAVVDRDPPARVLTSGEMFRPAMMIRVANSATLGVASTEDLGGSLRIKVPRRIGLTPEVMGIFEPKGLDQWSDEGMLSLDVM